MPSGDLKSGIPAPTEMPAPGYMNERWVQSRERRFAGTYWGKGDDMLTANNNDTLGLGHR